MHIENRSKTHNTGPGVFAFAVAAAVTVWLAYEVSLAVGIVAGLTTLCVAGMLMAAVRR